MARGTLVPPPKRVIDDKFAEQISFFVELSNFIKPRHLNFLRDYVDNLVRRVPDPLLTADNLSQELSQVQDVKAFGTDDGVAFAAISEFQNAVLHSKELQDKIPDRYQGVALGPTTLEDIKEFLIDTGRIKLEGKYLKKTDKFNTPINDLAYEDTRQIADESVPPTEVKGVEPPDSEELDPFDPTIRERAIAENKALGQTTKRERDAIEIATQIIDEVLPGEGKFILEEDPAAPSDLLGPTPKKRGRKGGKKRTVVKLEDFKRKSTLPGKTSAVPPVVKAAAKKGINWGLVAKFALKSRMFNPVMTLVEALISSEVANKGEDAFLQNMHSALDDSPPDKRQAVFNGIMGYTNNDEDLFAVKAPEHIQKRAKYELENRDDAPELDSFTPVDRSPTLKEDTPATPFDDVTDENGDSVKAKIKALTAKAKTGPPLYTPPGSPDEPISFEELSKMRKSKPPTKD